MEEFVGLSEYRVIVKEGFLKTIGLGSCVGIGFYDQVQRVAGLAHIFLGESKNNPLAVIQPGKYADTAIPRLLDEMVGFGAQKSRIIAKLAGGGQLFKGGIVDIGKMNADTVKTVLKQYNIPVVSEYLGQTVGVNLTVNAATGKMIVEVMGGKSIEL